MHRRVVPETVRITDLANLGLTLEQIRAWPVVEYTDAEGRYWLGEDLMAVFGDALGDNR